MPLELFAPHVDLITQFLKSTDYRISALQALHSFVHKGMDYPSKVELIANLKFMDILESFQPKFRDRPGEDAPLDEQDEEEEFFTALAEISDKLGQWCLELYQN
jgi:hypothetical protein